VDTPVVPQGLLVLPGTYEVRLTVDGRTSTQPLTVAMDPRVHATPADLAAQRDVYGKIAEALERTTPAQKQIEAVAVRLKSLDQELGGQPDLQKTAQRLAASVGRFRDNTSEMSLDTVAGVLTAIATDVEACDCAPTAPQREVLTTYRARLDAALAAWQALATGPLSDLDRQVRAAGLAPVVP
jgi:hypothetical protein